MKKLLLATSILAGSAGVATADVSFSGSAYMGMSNAYYDAVTLDQVWQFVSRVRIKATGSGDTDGGLSYGVEVESHNFEEAGDGSLVNQNGGSKVWIEGSFGKITMGDVAAVDNLIGNVEKISIDLPSGGYQELGFVGNTKTAVKYEGTFGNLSVAAGVGQLEAEDAYSIGVKYSFGDFAVYAGYEDAATEDQTTLGVDATFGNFLAKLRVVDWSGAADIGYAVSGTGTFDAIKVTAFYADQYGVYNAYGIGASYDLGGGASFVIGAETQSGAGAFNTDTLIDMGMKFSF